MAVLLTILKVIGIVLLVILILAAALLGGIFFVPVRYTAELRHGSRVRLGFRISWLLRAVQIRKRISEERVRIYIFGIPSQRLRSMFRRGTEDDMDLKYEAPPEKSEVGMVDDFYEEAKREQDKRKEDDDRAMASLETDYEEEGQEEKGSTKEESANHASESRAKKEKKKYFSFDRISSIITFIRDCENKKGFGKIKKEAAGLVRYVMPTYVSGRLVFGTGDPCNTGWLLGIISMFPFAYQEGVNIRPVFEEKVFEAEGEIRGKLRVIYFLKLFVRGYRDEEIMKVINNAQKIF